MRLYGVKGLRVESFPRAIRVTVCVAAICDRTSVIAACDRMLTAGDVEFEPATSKIRWLTSSCGAMIAGDANFHTEILQFVEARVGKLVGDAKGWLSIAELAAVYKEEIDAAVRRAVERRVLVPFGLTMDAFLARQQELSANFVRDVQSEILNFRAPAVEAIVTGVDETGPHIFTVSNAWLQCHDAVGFAAIGGGYWHSNSQMMAFSHTPNHSLADTLMSVMFSKKRAEVAPGVGAATDMFSIIGLGKMQIIGEHVTEELEKRYAEEGRRRDALAKKSRGKIHAFIEGLLNSPKNEQAAIPSVTDGTPSDVLPQDNVES